MNRKEWMLPREETIGRSLNPEPTGWTAEGRRMTKRAMMLLACATVALTLLAGAALLSVGDEKEPTEVQPEIPGSSSDIPPPPYTLCGYTYAPDGVTKLPDCAVTITNVRTSASTVISSGATSFYYFDISGIGYVVGDTIHVEAVKGSLVGENSFVVPDTGSYTQLNITLIDTIPEFPMVAVPVVGTLALLAFVGIRRGRKK